MTETCPKQIYNGVMPHFSHLTWPEMGNKVPLSPTSYFWRWNFLLRIFPSGKGKGVWRGRTGVGIWRKEKSQDKTGLGTSPSLWSEKNAVVGPVICSRSVTSWSLGSGSNFEQHCSLRQAQATCGYWTFGMWLVLIWVQVKRKPYTRFQRLSMKKKKSVISLIVDNDYRLRWWIY